MILSSFSEEDNILSGNIDKRVVCDDTPSFCGNDCAHFKKSDFPLAFAFEFHDSRKSIIENRFVIGIGERNGGNWSAGSTQDVGKERRRRQRREGTVVDGGLGVESSVEIGKVHFEVAAIENKLNKDFVGAVIDSKLNTNLESKGFDVRLTKALTRKFILQALATTNS